MAKATSVQEPDENGSNQSSQGWIDSHAHVYAKEFDSDRMDVLERARQQTIRRIVMPNVDHTSIDVMLETELRAKGQCFPAMGLHPCSVKKDFQRELYIVEEWLAKRSFAAVGEIGTDLYWDKTFWDEQQEAFTIQVEWARKYDLPVIIHCRETLAETIEMIGRLQDGKLRGVFHCFTGTAEQAEKIARLGFYLGIGGVATFKKGGLDAVLDKVALEKIMLETDSPYLAPVPHRGKRNEPSFIPLIGSRVAEIMQITVEEVRRHTTENALQLFPQIS